MPLIVLLACAAAPEPELRDTGELDCTLGRDAVWITASDRSGDTLAFSEFDGEFTQDGRNWSALWTAGLHFGVDEFIPFARRAFDAGPGRYQLVVWADGYQGWEGHLDVQDGDDGQLETRFLHLTLESDP